MMGVLRPPSAVTILHISEIRGGGVPSYLDDILPYQEQHFGTGAVRALVPAGTPGLADDVRRRLFMEFPHPGRSPLALARFAWIALATMRRLRPRLVHAHAAYAGIAVRLAAPLVHPQPKIVYCAHGWHFMHRAPDIELAVARWMERGLSRASDRIINITRYQQQGAVAAGLPEDRMCMIYNGVPDPAPAAGTAGARSGTGAEGTADPAFDPAFVNLLFVGRFDRQKGLDILLDAMRVVQDRPIRLYVAGDFVRQSAGRIDAPPNVVLLGWIRREALDAYYAAADAVVMPSRWEAFGLVAIEAMRNGTPVIASDLEGFPEIIGHGVQGYLFDIDDRRALPALLRTLDKDTLRRLGNNAREHFRRHFHADRMNLALVTLYQETLASAIDS